MGACLSGQGELSSAGGGPGPETTPQRGGGRSVGGASSQAEDPKEAMRRAALERQEKMNPAMERAAKQELLGKLTELYTRTGKSHPFNLGALPLVQLRKLYVDMGGRN